MGAVVVALLAVPASASASTPEQWQPRMAAAASYAEDRRGSVSFAVVTADGRLWRRRAHVDVHAASVVKVMFMVAYLRQRSVRDRALRDRDRDLLRPMIRRSDNAAASRIADQLGPRPLRRLAERAGMRDFSYTRPWGSTRTSARDQARFMFDVRRHVPRRHRAYALGLLNRIVPSQRWGIGEVDTPGWDQHFKGGWGSGSGAVNHQVVLLRTTDGARVALAVMITGSPSHAYASTTLKGVFRRLLSGLP